jgi:chromosome segregation ATPase
LDHLKLFALRIAHVDAPASTADWDLVKEALARLREDNDRFEQYCLEQLNDLEAQRAALAEREKQLDGSQSSANEELVQSRAQLARLAGVAMELADTRAELVEMRRQLDEQRELTAQAEFKAAAYEKKVAKLQQENAALEADMDEVRHLADDQKRRVAEERAEWVGELLRSALDIQSQLAGGSDDADLKVVHHDNEMSVEGAASVGRIDPVLSAVMAQFETLQKGRERPAGGGKSGRQGVA